MKHTPHSGRASKVLGVALTSVALASTIGAQTAHAVIGSADIHNVAGGGVNVAATDQCVQKVGDTAHVEYLVQHQPLVHSSDDGQTSADGYIAIPKAMENVKISLEAVVATDSNDETTEGQPQTSVKTTTIKLSNPVEIKSQDSGDQDNPLSDDELRKAIFPMPVKSTGEQGKDSWKYPEIKSEEDVIKYASDFTMVRYADGATPYEGYTPGFAGDKAEWYGIHNDDYDIYRFQNNAAMLTFKVEGDVKTIGEDTFAPVAATNLGWKSSNRYNLGSYEVGSQSLQEYAWAQTGFLPPALPTDEKIIETYKAANTPDGLDVMPNMVPTKEVPGEAKYSRIGTDIHNSPRGDVGAQYASQFQLSGGQRDIAYRGQVPQSGEDGGDIAAAHITLCDESTPAEKPGEKPGDTPSEKPGEKPGDTPSEKPGEKPGDTPSEKPGKKPGDTPSEKPGEKTPGSHSGGAGDSSDTGSSSVPSKDTKGTPLNGGGTTSSGDTPRSLASSGGSTAVSAEGEGEGPTVETGGATASSFFAKLTHLFR